MISNSSRIEPSRKHLADVNVDTSIAQVFFVNGPFASLAAVLKVRG